MQLEKEAKMDQELVFKPGGIHEPDKFSFWQKGSGSG
jgi:hypothetical protein